jgi:uncharacterized protein YjbI with pentapeptide repeats
MSDRRTQSAIRRIDLFEKKFGKPHLYLAYYAAFPLALTPDLVYRLWANFPKDSRGNELDIPWTAVADLLLSNLCQVVGYELYEMEQVVREELLRRLKADPNFSDRIGELADFLLEYVKQQLYSDNPDDRTFAQAQQWVALAYIRPGEAAKEIAQTLRKMQPATSSASVDKSELLRLASLVETMTEPLKGTDYEPLLTYFKGIESFAAGNLEQAQTELAIFSKSDKIEIQAEEFPIPKEIRASWNLPDFSRRKLCGRSFKGQDLTGANFSNTDLRGANFIGAKLVGANFSNARMGMQRRWAIGLMCCCFLLTLFAGVGISLVSLGFSSLLTNVVKGAVASAPTEFSWKVFNDLLLWSSLSFLVGLVGIHIISNGKAWRNPWKSWTFAFMFSPICLIIGNFITGYRLDLEQGSNNIIIFSDTISAVLFGIISCLIIWKGLGARWVAPALAWVGFLYIGIVVLVILAGSWSSIVKNPLDFVLSTLFIGWIFLLSFITFQTLISRQRKVVILAASTFICLGISVVLGTWLPSQSEVTKTFFISIASAVDIILFVLASTWHGSRSKTLAGILLKASAFPLIIILSIMTVSLFTNLNVRLTLTSSSIPTILGMGAAILLVISIFVLLTIPTNIAGFISLRGAILGIILMIVPMGIIIGISSIKSLNLEIFSSGILDSIIIVNGFLIGIMLALSCAITMGLTIAIVWAECGNLRIAMVWSSVLISMPIIATIAAAIMSDWGSVVIAGTIIAALAFVQLGFYIGRQAISGDPKFAAIRQSALSIAALSGTNFWGADLSGANFTQATLKNANFTQANLNNVRWGSAKKRDLAYIEVEPRSVAE